MSKKPLGASYWQALANGPTHEVSELIRGVIACPDDDAPLDWHEPRDAFVCPACEREFREADGLLSALPGSDAYRASADHQSDLESAARARAHLPDDPAEAYGPLWTLALRAMGDLSGKRVLDLGAGRGGASLALVAAGARHVVSLDIVAGEGGLGTARSRKPPGAPMDLVHGDMARLPFLAGSFDVIFAGALLAGTPHPGRVAVEMARVLDPGGVVVNVGEPLGRHRASGLAGGDPRREGRTMALADYEAIYREGDLLLHPLFADEAPPNGHRATWWHRVRRHLRHHHTVGERLLIARKAHGTGPVESMMNYLESRPKDEELQ